MQKGNFMLRKDLEISHQKYHSPAFFFFFFLNFGFKIQDNASTVKTVAKAVWH